jgi:hypothetical protein
VQGYNTGRRKGTRRKAVSKVGRRGGGLITPDGNHLRRRAAPKLLTADDVAAISGLNIDTVYTVFSSKRVNVRSVWGVVQAIKNTDTPDPRFATGLLSASGRSR